MNTLFSLSQFSKRFPTNDACLEEIKILRFPKGMYCRLCDKITRHYKIRYRTAYSCEFCRHHVYPLSGTIFEKSATPLRMWFFCMYLMTATRGNISAIQLHNELHVTYKTAFRIKKRLYNLMKQNHSDLLKGPEETISVSFFNAFELKITNKQESL